MLLHKWSHLLLGLKLQCWGQPALLTCCRVMLADIMLTSTRMVGVVCSQHTNRCTITLQQDTQHYMHGSSRQHHMGYTP